MGSKQFRVSIATLLGFGSAVMLLWLLWGKVQLGLIRYFDADELAYLHWAHNVFSGQVPYKDFLLYVPPGFLYVLAPLFAFLTGSATLLGGRVFAFLVFVGIVVVTALIFWRVRRSWAAILVGVILVFLPLPADKFIEIRPDNIAMLFALIGMWFQIQGLHTGVLKATSWFYAGVWYGLSLLILPKTLPQIGASCLVTLLWAFWYRPERKLRWAAFVRLLVGLGFPMILFGVWVVVTTGGWKQIETILYSLIILPLEVNRISELYPILQWHFFYPNATYYGSAGWSIGVIANHFLWLVGLLVGILRLVTPYIPGGKRGVWVELLIAGSFMMYIVAFLYWYPMRHAQYLIPTAVFVAFYVADAVDLLWKIASQNDVAKTVFAVCFFALLPIFSMVYQSVHSPKLQLTNREDITILERAIATIPEHAYVLDLVGATIYFTDPYYVCCVPFGQWEPYVTKPLPNLGEALIATHTQYIYQGRLRRVQTLSQVDQAYISTHFVPLDGDPSMLVRRD